jgi:hypothetical protein
MDGAASFLEAEEAVQVAVEASGDGRFLAIEAVEESGVAGVGSNAAVRKAAGSGTEESSGAGPIWLRRAADFDGPGVFGASVRAIGALRSGVAGVIK